MRVSEVFELQFPYRSFYSWDTDVLRNPARRITASVGNKCKKTDDQTDTIVINNNNERKDLAF